jgi:phosphonatase-like hydrolase
LPQIPFMSVDLIVFDLAGTTVHDDNDVPRMLQQSLAKFDVDIPLEAASKLMGIPKPVAIRSLLENNYYGYRTIDTEWIEQIHQVFVSGMIHFYQTDPTVREKEGVTETFEKLKSRGVKIALDTGFDRATTTPLLHRMDWNGLVDVSITSDEVPRGRPFPDMIFKAMAMLQSVDAQHVAKVGDTASDIQQGRAAGCRWIIGVTTGAYSEKELTKEKPTHLVSTISEILPILNID